MNVFKDILDRQTIRKENVKQKINEQKRHELRVLETRKQRYNNLKELAEGFESDLKKCPNFMVFFENLIKELERDLKSVTMTSKRIEEQALMTARVSAEIHLLDRIMTDPQAVIREYRKRQT